MLVYHAPLQGVTDAVYRAIHNSVVGGVAAYYTPFVRWEHGGLRAKDLRDVAHDANVGVETVPQVIARDGDEFARLCDALQALGWCRIDLNMGCPFPPQAHSGRGSGLLQHMEKVCEIVEEMRRRPEVQFSVKMRLGYDDATQALRLLPLLDEASLCCIVMHARVGLQQYKGDVDLDAFEQFYEACSVPLIYNGDLFSRGDVCALQQRFPRLAGVMLGRGLLRDAAMHIDCTVAERRQANAAMHDGLLQHAVEHLCGWRQVLAKMATYWQYRAEGADIDTMRKVRRLLKSRSLAEYRQNAIGAGV